MAISRWTSKQKKTSGIWAAAIGAVVFVGSLTGAQLKSDRQKEEVQFPISSGFAGCRANKYQAIRQFRETSTEEQITALETQKKHLLQQRAGLQRKLDVFHERVRERQKELAKRDNKPDTP